MSRRKGIQLAYPYESNRLKRWGNPYLIQPKLDGDRCRAILKRDCKPILLSSEEHPIVSLPHIEEQLSIIREKVELDGELYLHGTDHDSIRSIVGRKKNLHYDHEQMEYHVFDIVEERVPQWKRLDRLANLFHVYGNRMPSVKMVPTYVVETEKEIFEMLEKAFSSYEGFILRELNAPYLRKRSTYMMKFKPRKEDVYKVVDTIEEVSKDGIPKNSLGAFVCEKDGETFNVGSGSLLTRENRQVLWGERGSLPGLYIRVYYQHITPGRGVPRHGVVVELITKEKICNAF